MIRHQNIRGLANKTDEFLISSSNIPHVHCLTEHHVWIEEINVYLDKYTLGTYFCRQTYKQGGVSIYVSKEIQYNTVNFDHYIKEKDFEAYALKLQVLSNNLVIICIYRSHTGKFSYFLNQLELNLNILYKISTNIILCGDFNTHLFDIYSRVLLLQSLLASFNLFSTVTFPTRIFNNSYSLIDNIYIDTNRFNFSVYPLTNGLSDHDAQVINLSNILCSSPEQLSSYIRRTDNNTVWKFTELLSYEIWEDVFQDSNVNIIFNNFCSIYLRIFNTSFPIKKIQESLKHKSWLTSGIRTSCANKRKLYVTYRSSNDLNFKIYYKKYCKILSSMIAVTKKSTLMI